MPRSYTIYACRNPDCENARMGGAGLVYAHCVRCGGKGFVSTVVYAICGAESHGDICALEPNHAGAHRVSGRVWTRNSPEVD